MDHLFFDIECADGHKICSFGYVITDARFNILKEDDILIDPECAFKLGRSGFDARIHLAYSPDEFRNNPNFSARYKEISSLLTAPDRTLWGHAVAADAEYLDIACDRYNKKRFDVAVHDTQRIYAEFRSNKQTTKLEKIMEECEIDVSHLTAHNSRDDAKMSMLTVKYICKKNGLSADELIAAHAEAVVDRASMEKAYRHRQLKKIVEHNQSRYHRDYKKWQSVYIADVVDKFEVSIAEKIIDTVFNMCYAFELRLDKCDYCVVCDKNVDEEKSGQAQTVDRKTITYEELSEMLRVNIDSDGNIGEPDGDGGFLLGELLEKALKGKKIAQ